MFNSFGSSSTRKGLLGRTSAGDSSHGSIRGSSPKRKQLERELHADISRGDSLCHSLTLGVPHSSIYVGNDQVVGINNIGNKTGVVTKVPIDADPVLYVYGADSKYSMYSKESTAQRAESKLGRRSTYDTWYHNCHNFTNWARTGVDYNSFGGKADKGIFCRYTPWNKL